MKKIFIYLLIFVITIITIITINISNNNSIKKNIREFNLQYEMYNNKILQGTDVATIINKAINNNEKNKIAKDSNGYYIENEGNCIIVSVILYDEQEKIEYRMETIDKVGTNKFINNFNLIEFKMFDIKYNSNGRVNKIILEQV